jgi:hypothetical protein
MATIGGRGRRRSKFAETLPHFRAELRLAHRGCPVISNLYHLYSSHGAPDPLSPPKMTRIVVKDETAITKAWWKSAVVYQIYPSCVQSPFLADT